MKQSNKTEFSFLKWACNKCEDKTYKKSELQWHYSITNRNSEKKKGGGREDGNKLGNNYIKLFKIQLSLSLIPHT